MWETGHWGTSISAGAWWELGHLLLRQPFLSCTSCLLPASLRQSLLLPTFWGCAAPRRLHWSKLIRLILTLVRDCGFQCQHMHCTSGSCWKPELNTGCDILCGRTGDICSLQSFLWRRIKTSAFLDFCACAGEVARDGGGRSILTQTSSGTQHSNTFKGHQSVFPGCQKGQKERERRLNVPGCRQTEPDLRRERLAFKDETVAELKPNEFAGILCLADSNESARCLQQSIIQCGGEEFASSHVF